jgi:hypothetical protein
VEVCLLCEYHYNRCRGGVSRAPRTIAYAPTATANTVAVLLSAEEAEDMTRQLSKLMSAPMLCTPE